MPLMHRTRTVLTGLVEGGGVSTLYFNADDDIDYNAVVGLTQTFWQALQSAITSMVTIQVQSEVDILDETGALIGSGSGAPQLGFNGGAAGAALPPATQGLLRLGTGVVAGGRRVQGRLFVPGPVTGAEGGTQAPGTDYRTDLTNAAQALITGSASTNAQWLVWSRKNAAVAFVQDVSVWEKWAVLRSRRD